MVLLASAVLAVPLPVLVLVVAILLTSCPVTHAQKEETEPVDDPSLRSLSFEITSRGKKRRAWKREVPNSRWRNVKIRITIWREGGGLGWVKRRKKVRETNWFELFVARDVKKRKRKEKKEEEEEEEEEKKKREGYVDSKCWKISIGKSEKLGGRDEREGEK